MPKISRPESWDGYDLIDVKEFARRSGRTENAIRIMVKRGKLQNRADDGRVMLDPADAKKIKPRRAQQLRLLGNSK